ncbi:helix-turn-helix transcriptional regulator [Sphingomonas jatrophae]|uniref:helix-turn-helix transcriptional regulator n=1 Tax=Sphingomonas jatrophae TaxID=1166337 RepID=UPI0013F4BDFE|nr:AraC family transcriptional regulator [Sphingomonas jatrophae]
MGALLLKSALMVDPVSIADARRDPRLVRAALALPGIAVELCDYPEVAPQTVTVVEPQAMLSLGLSPLLPQSEGRFGRAGTRFARFGSLSFRPAGVPSELRFAGGAFETIRCRFEGQALPPALHGKALDEAQLAACFDIRRQPIEDAMLRLAEEVAQPREDSIALAQALVDTIRLDLARYLAEAGRLAARRSGGLTPRQLRRCAARIDADGPPPAIDELAALCGLSRFHFMRTFRATTGESVGSFVQRARMARAKAMLARDDGPLADIAHALGYRSAAAFSAAFHRVVGRPPGAFRTAIRS